VGDVRQLDSSPVLHCHSPPQLALLVSTLVDGQPHSGHGGWTRYLDTHMHFFQSCHVASYAVGDGDGSRGCAHLSRSFSRHLKIMINFVVAPDHSNTISQALPVWFFLPKRYMLASFSGPFSRRARREADDPAQVQGGSARGHLCHRVALAATVFPTITGAIAARQAAYFGESYGD
jgi:hypothetical protein